MVKKKIETESKIQKYVIKSNFIIIVQIYIKKNIKKIRSFYTHTHTIENF